MMLPATDMFPKNTRKVQRQCIAQDHFAQLTRKTPASTISVITSAGLPLSCSRNVPSTLASFAAAWEIVSHSIIPPTAEPCMVGRLICPLYVVHNCNVKTSIDGQPTHSRQPQVVATASLSSYSCRSMQWFLFPSTSD